MTPLIDTTEMYLRTVWELEEEGITPMRARLVERLALSAPAVSETVGRLEEEGLLRIGENRTLGLTEDGRKVAVSVMRKHRLAELLLTRVIGLDWERVHNEACRWEHVISDEVEQRLVALLDEPATCPHGNPIPGFGDRPDEQPLITLVEAAKKSVPVVLRRISEKVQSDAAAMRLLREHGLWPGTALRAGLADEGIRVSVDGADALVPEEIAEFVYVSIQ